MTRINADQRETESRARILEIGPYPPPYGGWTVRLVYLQSALIEQQHDCVVLNTGPNRSVPSDQYECVRSGLEYVMKLLRYAQRNYLMHIHMNGDSIKGFALAYIASLISLVGFRRPVLTFHAGTQQVYFPRQNSFILLPVLKGLFHLASRIICNNTQVKSEIARYGISPKKIVPIPAFSKQYLEDTAADLPRSVDEFLNSHAYTIFAYFETQPEYHVASVMQSLTTLAARYDELGIVVASSNENKPEIERLLRENSLGSRSLCLGSVDHRTFLSVLNRSSLFLRSNAREGSSSSIREALYLGVPVVANDSDSHPESVIGYPWGNATKMTEALSGVLEDLPAARQAVVKPEVRDTVTEEVELLVQCALRRAEPVRSEESAVASVR